MFICGGKIVIIFWHAPRTSFVRIFPGEFWFLSFATFFCFSAPGFSSAFRLWYSIRDVLHRISERLTKPSTHLICIFHHSTPFHHFFLSKFSLQGVSTYESLKFYGWLFPLFRGKNFLLTAKSSQQLVSGRCNDNDIRLIVALQLFFQMNSRWKSLTAKPIKNLTYIEFWLCINWL